MAILPVLLFPDPVLRKPSRAVSRPEDVKELIHKLTETLLSQPNGIGIAAPQIGENLRVFIMDVSPRDFSKKRHVMMNPVILRRGREVMSREGCMSLPDYTANVRRSEWVAVAWQDEKGRPQKKTFHGIEAMCVQHEMDHLDGLLILDRVSCLKTDVLPRKTRA